MHRDNKRSNKTVTDSSPPDSNRTLALKPAADADIDSADRESELAHYGYGNSADLTTCGKACLVETMQVLGSLR